MPTNDLADLVDLKIRSLRPKLLDLSRRNPLISTKLSPRSNSHIRAVDELPDVLFFKLNNGQTMRLVPLPPIDDDPRDEATPVFRDALINARITDEQFLAEIGSVDQDADDYLDQARKIERALKDRVRQNFGMPQRTNAAEINLADHARINGITPSHELPGPATEDKDGRYNDDNIQTLLLPSDLERKLNAISSKCRMWIQETGINVFHIAFGFLEWSDGTQQDTSFAPLILCEAQIERRRTFQGVEFWIASSGDAPELNAVLAEKLRSEFHIELPPFSEPSVEKYLTEIAALAPLNMTWRARRQVAIGVFPSARMAMYHDIDPDHPDFPDSEIVRTLLVGGSAGGSAPFADEYEVDQPEIEQKVPYLVMDADSSQFSTLVDVVEGKNIAVEGPPGTGKSQTIVNAIAAALATGKKVLFVAQKLAALNVVKSRLEAVGLGEFLLPLQAERSTREQVIDSVRERMEMRGGSAVRDYDLKIDQYRKTRDQIAKYIDLLTRVFDETGFTVREVLGKQVASNSDLVGISPDTLAACSIPTTLLHRSGLRELRELGQRVVEASKAFSEAKPHWRLTRLSNPDRFTVEEICHLAALSGKAFSDLADARDKLVEVSLPIDVSSADLRKILVQLGEALTHIEQHPKMLLLNLLSGSNSENVTQYLDRCEACQQQHAELSAILATEPGVECIESIAKTIDICARHKLSTISPAILTNELEKKGRLITTSLNILAALRPFVECRPESKTWSLEQFAKAHSLRKAAGDSVLALRNARNAEPDGVYLLQRLCQEGKALQAQREKLAESVSIATDTPVEALADCVSVLRGAGFFRFFSARHREAKRLFRSMSRIRKYRRRNAIQTLEALVVFRRGRSEFELRFQPLTALDPYFNGLETDFEPYEQLAHFYRNVDSQINAPDGRAIRTFLREAPLKELELIPPIPPTATQITYESLEQGVAAAETNANTLGEAIADLRTCVHVFVDPASVDPADLGRLHERVLSLVDEMLTLDRREDIKSILGIHFEGSRSRSDALTSLLRWAGTEPSLNAAISVVVAAGNTAIAPILIKAVLEAENLAEESLRRLSIAAKIEPVQFATGRPSRETAAALNEASEDAAGLFASASFATVVDEVRPWGLAPLVDERSKGKSGLAGLTEQFEAVAARQMARSVHSSLGGQLFKYDGRRLDELRKKLADLDREIIQLSRKQLRAKLFAAARPPKGNGVGRKSEWTELSLIENEISKQQRFISVRDLTQRAGRALSELKPCWMMSPLAVAQYVARNSVHFDLCIIDEASQMPPEEAIGALLRCDQAMVVGDTNQLPPTSFFKTLIDDEYADEDEAVLDESVLEMANATFRPARRLRWHYRSRHSGLIRFSNRLVYDDSLVVFPSATESLTRMGVHFQSVSGLYKAGTNPVEAKAIVEAALEFMRTDPDRSLGIVTLNQKQRDLISEEFEFAVKNSRDAIDYIEDWKERSDGLEEFFIKNLENVQGDERDVIFIGTVYGAEAAGGKVMQRFGPINGLAGKRRLNVLFTRAREKIVTFSSMTSADILAEEHGNQGAYMLRRWLEYCATGVLEGGTQTEREPDSEFEVFVMNQIRSMGCDPVPQVGVAGYFIDIGIRHPQWPYGYILGVECDGANYHSAKSARDRDRLRQEVLENLGWRLHRIWSTDWFNDPKREADRLREVISARLLELKRRESEFTATVPRRKGDSELDQAIIVRGLSDIEERGAPEQSQTIATTRTAASNNVAVGDTVRVRHLDGDRKTFEITISQEKSDPTRKIVHHKSPIAMALLGAEVGDEVEVLVGNYVMPAVVESVKKKPRHV